MGASNFKGRYELYCREIFDFLIKDYGYKFVNTEKAGFGIFSRFTSPVAIIEVWLDLRDKNVDICMYSAKVERGKFQSEIRLGQLSDTAECIEVLRYKVQDDAGLKFIFKKYAEILRKYGEAVLRGDFSAFPSRQESYEKLWGDNREHRGI